MTVSCLWCRPNPDPDADPTRLCRPHLAEYEGLTEAELDRSDAEQYADSTGGF